MQWGLGNGTPEQAPAANLRHTRSPITAQDDSYTDRRHPQRAMDHQTVNLTNP